MLRAILFDLDGTLIRYELDSFLDRYLRALAAKVAAYVDPERFVRQVVDSTYVTINNRDGKKTNKEVFMGDFFSKIGVAPELLVPLFDEFYANDYGLLGRYVKPAPFARDVVARAFALGYDVVIATNPVFPARAVQERLRWGGLDSFPYRLVTSYEIMHYCKPHREYFEEVLEMVRRRPEECIMVGNDVDEDLAAGQVGMRTFLVKDSMINRQGITPKADWVGGLEDFLGILEGSERGGLRR